MECNSSFVSDIQNVSDENDLIILWKAIIENSYLNWYINPVMPDEAVNDFKAIGKMENGLEKQKKLLAELLDKNQLYVNLSEINDEQFKVSEEDKALNKAFYGEI